VDSTVLGLLVLGVFALPFIAQRWSLIASYAIGGLIAAYGVVSIVLSFVEQNHLSGLAQILGAAAFIVGASIVVFARILYRRKNQSR
jgi:drug/metabolite transporter superfamily protein YnfA